MYIHLPNSETAVKPGDKVVLGRHDMYQAWHNEMEKYVGLVATIISYASADYYGKHRFNVDIDGGVWMWRVENMTYAPNALDCTFGPAICVECHSLNEYVMNVAGFICKICKSWKEHLSK